MPTVERQLQIDGSIESRSTFDIYPEPTDLASKAPLEFVIHSTPYHYIDLKTLYIDAKLRITNAAGDRPVGGEGAAGIANWQPYFINNLSQSLWRVIQVFLNDTCIESNYNNQQISNLAQILTTPNEIIRERGICQGIFPVTDTSLVSEIGANHVGKNDIAPRITFTKDNQVHIKGPLHLDLTTSDRFLIDNVKLKIILEPSSPSFLINAHQLGGNNNIDFNYQIESVKLQCSKVRPSDGALLASSKMLVNKPLEYILRKNICHVEVIPANYSDFTITRPFQDLIPNKIYIFLVDREAASGSYIRPPFFYHHFDLMHYSVKVNGIEIQGGDISTKHLETYIDSLISHGGGDFFIPYKNYTSGCYVLCVDTNNYSNFNSLQVERKGNLTISLQFRNALNILHSTLI